MRLDGGLDLLPVPMKGFDGSETTLNLTLIYDERELVLVDAADPFKGEIILGSLKECYFPRLKPSRLILTHHDMDHIGSAEELVRLTKGGLSVYAHELEVPYILGEKPSIKIPPEEYEQLKKDMERMSPDVRKGLAKLFEKRNFTIDEKLKGGEVLPFCGGIEVIHTPGHTPGHIALYLKRNKTLISGDALTIVDGRLSGPMVEHSYRIDEARQSVRKFLDYDISRIICYHGGVYDGDPTEELKRLIRSWE